MKDNLEELKEYIKELKVQKNDLKKRINIKYDEVLESINILMEYKAELGSIEQELWNKEKELPAEE